MCSSVVAICMRVRWKASTNLSWCLPCSKYIEKCKQKRERKTHLRRLRSKEKCICNICAAMLFIRCSDRHFSTLSIGGLAACSMRQCRFVIFFSLSDTGSGPKPRVTFEIYFLHDANVFSVLIHAYRVVICWVLPRRAQTGILVLRELNLPPSNQRSQSCSMFASSSAFAQCTRTRAQWHWKFTDIRLLSVSRQFIPIPILLTSSTRKHISMISFLRQRRNAHSVWTRDICLACIFRQAVLFTRSHSSRQVMKRRTWTHWLLCCC